MPSLYPGAYERLKAMLDALEPEIKDMTGSSPGFIRDMLDKSASYGESMFVSPKQLQWVENLYEKYVGPLDAVGDPIDPQQGARDDTLGNDIDDDIPF